MKNTDDNQRILVTGGAGFIGSTLIDRLLTSTKARISCVDNFDPFYDVQQKEGNIAQAKKNSRYQLFCADITDKKSMDAIFREAKPKIVVHLAARAGVRPSLANPAAYHRTNVEGTLNILECARDHAVERFVFGSSSSVYGVSSRVPFKETDALHYPISPYAVTKIAAEQLCRVFHRYHGMSVACLRFFTVYGPRQRPEMAIAKFARKILDGETIDMYGDGSSSRDYTFVEDIVDGVIAAMEKPIAFEIINLGNSHAVRLKDLLSTLASITKIQPRIRRLPDQAGDVPITFASVAKAKRLLGYKPKARIREGIARYVQWLKETHEPR